MATKCKLSLKHSLKQTRLRSRKLSSKHPHLTKINHSIDENHPLALANAQHLELNQERGATRSFGKKFMIRRKRLPFLFLAFASMIIGLLAGLNRIGWNIPFNSVVPEHGAIMVGGFLGTLITLEKIITLKKSFLYTIPIASGLSVVSFLLRMPQSGYILLIAASTGLCVVFFMYLITNPGLIYAVMLLGAICWLIGNILLMTSNFYPMSLPWWMAFVLCIISSERIELMKFLPVTEGNKRFLAILLALFVVACVLSFHGPGSVITAGVLSAISIWLLKFDLIGVTIKKKGLTRFVAVALLTGYFALLLTSLFLLQFNVQPEYYDIIVHLFFIGFVFSMIFAHGPIILPGVLGISAKPYSRLLYLWLGLLHVSLIMRVSANILFLIEVKMLSGILTGAAIVGYFMTVGYLVITQGKQDGKVS